MSARQKIVRDISAIIQRSHKAELALERLDLNGKYTPNDWYKEFGLGALDDRPELIKMVMGLLIAESHRALLWFIAGLLLGGAGSAVMCWWHP
jgi:hypothetical protein